MKKLFCSMLFLTLLLAACNSSDLSISEVQRVPKKVQEGVRPYYTLQLINEGDSTAYILYQTTGTVTADVEVKGNKLNIKLDKANQENKVLKQYIYKLTRGKAEFDTIDVLVDGQSMPLDNVTGVD